MSAPHEPTRPMAFFDDVQWLPDDEVAQRVWTFSADALADYEGPDYFAMPRWRFRLAVWRWRLRHPIKRWGKP